MKITKEALKAFKLADCQLTAEVYVNRSLYLIVDSKTNLKWILFNDADIRLKDALQIIKSFAYYAGKRSLIDNYLNLNN
jgi:hypothetical protein